MTDRTPNIVDVDEPNENDPHHHQHAFGQHLFDGTHVHHDKAGVSGHDPAEQEEDSLIAEHLIEMTGLSRLTPMSLYQKNVLDRLASASYHSVNPAKAQSVLEDAETLVQSSDQGAHAIDQALTYAKNEKGQLLVLKEDQKHFEDQNLMCTTSVEEIVEIEAAEMNNTQKIAADMAQDPNTVIVGQASPDSFYAPSPPDLSSGPKPPTETLFS